MRYFTMYVCCSEDPQSVPTPNSIEDTMETRFGNVLVRATWGPSSWTYIYMTETGCLMKNDVNFKIVPILVDLTTRTI